MEFINDLEEFKQKVDIIVANRIDDNIKDEKQKIYMRYSRIGNGSGADPRNCNDCPCGKRRRMLRQRMLRHLSKRLLLRGQHTLRGSRGIG